MVAPCHFPTVLLDRHVVVLLDRHVVIEVFFPIAFAPALFAGYALWCLYDIDLCLLVDLCALLRVGRLSGLCEEHHGKLHAYQALTAYHLPFDHEATVCDGHPYGVALHSLHDALRGGNDGHLYDWNDAVGKEVCVNPLMEGAQISTHSSSTCVLPSLSENATVDEAMAHLPWRLQSSLMVRS